MNDAFVRCLLFQLDCPRNKKALTTSVAHTFPSRENCKVFFSHLLVGSGKKGCDLVFRKFSHQLASLFDVVLCNSTKHVSIYLLSIQCISILITSTFIQFISNFYSYTSQQCTPKTPSNSGKIPQTNGHPHGEAGEVKALVEISKA